MTEKNPSFGEWIWSKINEPRKETSPEEKAEQQRYKLAKGMSKEDNEIAKSKALDACLIEHQALLKCYTDAWFPAVGCTKEYEAFWSCYKIQRGFKKLNLPFP